MGNVVVAPMEVHEEDGGHDDDVHMDDDRAMGDVDTESEESDAEADDHEGGEDNAGDNDVEDEEAKDDGADAAGNADGGLEVGDEEVEDDDDDAASDADGSHGGVEEAKDGDAEPQPATMALQPFTRAALPYSCPATKAACAGLTARLVEPPSTALTRAPKLQCYAEVYKMVYLYDKAKKSVSNVSVLLTLLTPVSTGRMFDSDTGAVVDLANLSGGLIPTAKYAVSEAVVVDARFVGVSTHEVASAMSAYLNGTSILTSQFSLHNGKDALALQDSTGTETNDDHKRLARYEVGANHIEPNAGAPGRNGCVQGIHVYGSAAAAFVKAVEAAKETSAALLHVSEAIRDEQPDVVEKWFRWNTCRVEKVAVPDSSDEAATGLQLMHAPEAANSVPSCFVCCRKLSLAESMSLLTIMSCGHGHLCTACATAVKSSTCPSCQQDAGRVGPSAIWFSPPDALQW